MMIAGTDALSLPPLLAASLPCVPTFSREIYSTMKPAGKIRLTVDGRHRSGNGRLPEMERAISGNASPGPLPRRDGVRCRQRGARYRQHMFPGLAWRTSGNELAHAGNGSFPAWGAHTPGNDPADVDNGSYPARGEHTPENDRVDVGKGSFPAWGASIPGNGLLLVAWHSMYCCFGGFIVCCMRYHVLC